MPGPRLERRRRPSWPLRGLAVVLASAVAFTAPMAAQPPSLTVTGLRNLGFGTLIPGLPTTVSPSDPVRAAQFDVRGASAQQLQLVLALPLSLQGPSGAALPLRWGPSAAAYSLSGGTADAIAFDPALPFTVALPASGRLLVFLGGTAQPLPTQVPGRFSAVITLTASSVGN
jgi:hypothetical protein